MTQLVSQALLPCPVTWCTTPSPQVQTRSSSLFVVRCNECGTTTPYFHTKTEAITAWNTRISHSLPGDALRKALRPFANAAKWWKAFDNQHRITTLHQHGDCLEVGHLRAALAALTPSALSGDAGENYRDCVEAALAPARQWWGGGQHGDDHIYLINNMMADLRVFHAPKAPTPSSDLGELERLRAEVVGYRKLTRDQQSRITKLEGALFAQPPINPSDGTWWYPEGDTSSDACCHGPSEALEGPADEMAEGEARVVVLERAIQLPDVYAALRVFTEAEKDARDDDEPWDFTLHATLEEARAALPSHQGAGEP